METKEVPTAEAVLYRLKVRVKAMVTKEFLLDSYVTVEKMLTDNFKVQLTAYLWGETETVQTVRYPKNWKEAFKERWFPSWLLRLSPIEFTEIVIEAKVMYPDLKVSMPREKHMVKITQREEG